MKHYSLLIVICALMLTACQKDQSPKRVEQVRPHTGAIVITSRDIQNAIDLLDKKDQEFAKTSFGRQNLLQILVREKIILQDAQATGFKHEKEYLEALKQKQAELDEIYQKFAQEALIRTWYEKNGKQLEPSEQEIKTYYKKYPYEMTIQQIIFDNAQTADQTLRILKGSPSRWKEMSRQYNIAPSSLQSLTFMPGEYLENLEAVAANSPVGKVQGFFKTAQGFHIIMKTGENRLSLEQATPRIKQILLNQHLDELLDTLKTQYEVIIDEENK